MRGDVVILEMDVPGSKPSFTTSCLSWISSVFALCFHYATEAGPRRQQPRKLGRDAAKNARQRPRRSSTGACGASSQLPAPDPVGSCLPECRGSRRPQGSAAVHLKQDLFLVLFGVKFN